MSDKCYIGDFRILRPRCTVDHDSSVRWLAAAHAKSESTARGDGFDGEGFRMTMERLIGRFGCGPESLAGRGHDLEDFQHQDWSRMRLFDLETNPHGAGMAARMDVFSGIADRALESFYPESETSAPDEIIHVTCTGYVAPSAPQKLIARRGWHSRVGVVHAYHMGCYASLPALRMASAFLASPRSRMAGGKRVDIVHTECCTLHLDPGRHEPEQLVVQSLFADGHIRYSMGRESSGGLRFLGAHEEIVPDSLESMGWNLGDAGMSMILSRDVPDRIAGMLRGFVLRMFERSGENPAETLADGVFAVHPGGPRIIDKVAELLELKPEQVAASRATLKAYGNMSSATLPHVWAAIARDDRVSSGTPIASLAFGPGLTVYGALLRKA